MSNHFVPLVTDVFDGKYGVNKYGDVKILRKSKYHKKEFMKPFINWYGYLEYNLQDAFGKVRHICEHRLVAIMLIPNPENKKYVNHLDGDKKNNHILNLEWCTASENELHSYRALGKTNSKPGLGKIGYEYLKGPHNVAQYDLSNNLVKVWFSPSVAEIEGGFNIKQISAVCNGRQRTHRGFIWKYI